MRFWGIVILLTYGCISGFAQNKRYFDWLDRTERDSIVCREVSTNTLDIINFDQQGYAGVLLENINALRVRYQQNALVEDSSASQVCNVGVKHFSKRFFRTNKFKKKIIRYTEFGLRHMNSAYRMFEVYTFNVNLTHLNRFDRFYYASGDETTALKLFKGQRPKYAEDDERYVKPVPVLAKTEMEFVSGLVKEMDKDILNRVYTHIGLAVRVDEYTLNRRKIPRAFVMIILSGKQTQKVRRRKLQKNKEEEGNPYYPLEQRE